MIISLIGMSGSGKSFWSKKLEKKGYKRLCCDDLLEEELRKEFKILGHNGTKAVSKWMGQPFEPQYKENSNIYILAEEKAMRQVISLLKNQQDDSANIVVDTTGSVIYLQDDILHELSTYTKIIYLKIPETKAKEMYALYLKDPKPVFWGDKFMKMNGEDNHDALARCYPNLLKYRAEQYENMAHITFDATALKDPSFTTEKFIKEIAVKIPQYNLINNDNLQKYTGQ